MRLAIAASIFAAGCGGEARRQEEADQKNATDPPSKHDAVKTTEVFYAGVAAGELDVAAKLTVPNRYPKDALQKMKAALRVEQAKARDAYVGKAQAAVVTDEIAPREEGKGRKGRWGVSLRLIDGTWLIRDLDFLPNSGSVEKYLDEFRKVEPEAKKAAVGK